MTVAVLLVLLVVLWWKSVAVWRDRRSVEQWAILVAILGVVITLTLEVLRVNPELAPGLDRRWTRLGQNLAIVSAFCSLQLFYLRYVAAFLRRPRLVLEIVLVVLTEVALTALTLRIIAIGADMSMESPNIARPPVTGFYVVGGAYIMYALITQLWWTARFGRRRDIADPLVRRAAIGAAVGSFFLLIAQCLRTLGLVIGLLIGAKLQWLAGPAMVLLLIGTPILVISLGLPVIIVGIRKAVTGLRQLRAHHQLAPLWQAVAWTYPELIRPERPTSHPLNQPGPQPSTWARSSRIGTALQHRLGQCREGYLRASPFTKTGPAIVADDRVALFVKHLQGCPAVNLDVADRPGKHGLPADTGEFVAVARALRAQGLAWCQPATGQQADASLSS